MATYIARLSLLPCIIHIGVLRYRLHDEEKNRPGVFSVIPENSTPWYMQVSKTGFVLQKELAKGLSVWCP